MILASGSPRRSAILATLGIEAEVMATDVDETASPGETADDLVERLARLKLAAALATLGPQSRSALVVAADTVVTVGQSIMGKPEGKADAERMLTTLSGSDHQVITGLAACLLAGGEEAGGPATAVERETTRVSFRPLDQEMISWYLATGEPYDKAGAYGIQGRGSLLVDGIGGSYLNVVGLPVVALDRLCRRLGWPLHRLAPNTAGLGVDS